ncbi:MAG: hypothetical protein R2747_08285 [Pyrinomonadaceae bacterium]
MKNLFTENNFLGLAVILICALGLACDPVPTDSNANANSPADANTNSNSNANSNANANASNSATDPVAFETEEPDQYQATVSLSIETTGENKTAIPKLQADVARQGDNRRMEFTAPNGEKIVYLTVGDKQLVIAPARRQYAELNKETLGVDVRKILTPDQMVDQVKKYEGVKRAGEEKFNGRDVVKYTFEATTDTQTKAGTVETESYFLVDKETKLPVQSVTFVQSQSGEVKGISGLKVVTEINNIKTDVDKSLFEEPKDFKKVEPEEVRSQLKAFFDMAQLVVGQLLKTSQNPNN